jgi:hypothetical protein
MCSETQRTLKGKMNIIRQLLSPNTHPCFTTLSMCLAQTQKTAFFWASRGDIFSPALHNQDSAKLDFCPAVWGNERSPIFIIKEHLASPLYINILKSIIIEEGKNNLWVVGTVA